MTPEDRLRQLFHSLLSRYAGAIEFWTVACLSRGDLGDPSGFVEQQWGQFLADVQQVRVALADLLQEPPPVVHEQVANLLKLAADLRDVFNALIRHADLEPAEVELAVLKLGSLWRDLQMRISLASAAIPLPAPLPGITMEQEKYYQEILDGLFDRFTASR
jgi:hypothetical protein